MLKALLVPVVVLALVAAGCGGETKGYVTGKRFDAAHTDIEYAGCGFHLDGSGYGCSAGKPVIVSHSDEWRVLTTGGSARVSRRTYDACRVGDWFQNDRCWDEKPGLQ